MHIIITVGCGTEAAIGIERTGDLSEAVSYGATTIAGGDGSRQPSENELKGARYQGRVVAETAIRLHG